MGQNGAEISLFCPGRAATEYIPYSLSAVCRNNDKIHTINHYR